MIGKHPIKATAFGSRQRRITGDQYDNFSVDFEYENGVHLHSMCRQIDGCSNNVSEFVQGTKGSWNSVDFTIRDLQGNELWKYDEEAAQAAFQQHDPYVLELVDWINHIRKGEGHVEAGERFLCGVMEHRLREDGHLGRISPSDMDPLPEAELGPMDERAHRPCSEARNSKRKTMNREFSGFVQSRRRDFCRDNRLRNGYAGNGPSGKLNLSFQESTAKPLLKSWISWRISASPVSNLGAEGSPGG